MQTSGVFAWLDVPMTHEPQQGRQRFINNSANADMVLRGSRTYAEDVSDLRYLHALGLPVGQIAVRMSRSPDAVRRMLETQNGKSSSTTP